MVNNDNTPDIVHANSIEKLSARKPNNPDALILPIALNKDENDIIVVRVGHLYNHLKAPFEWNKSLSKQFLVYKSEL